MGTTNGNELRLRHRRWVYGGLGVPPGVALVREREQGRRVLPGQILVVGDEIAQAIGPPLVRLARDASVAILVQAHAGAPASAWLEHGWIVSAVGRCRPDLLVLAFGAGQPADVVERLATVAAVPATLWLAPDESDQPADSVERVPVPRDAVPNAIGYAAWAGEVWESLSSSSL